MSCSFSKAHLTAVFKHSHSRLASVTVTCSGPRQTASTFLSFEAPNSSRGESKVHVPWAAGVSEVGREFCLRHVRLSTRELGQCRAKILDASPFQEAFVQVERNSM